MHAFARAQEWEGRHAHVHVLFLNTRCMDLRETRPSLLYSVFAQNSRQNRMEAQQKSDGPATSTIFTEGPLGSWFTVQNAVLELNDVHSAFQQVFYDHFRALLREQNHETYVYGVIEYVQLIQLKYMFVRIERPPRSKRFVLGYMKCERVFSFAPRYEQMRLRLNHVPPMLLTKIETGKHKALRLVTLGETDFERALAKHSDTKSSPLLAAIKAMDEDAVFVLLDGGLNPNETDESGNNALHVATLYHHNCSAHLAQTLVEMTEDVNLQNKDGVTALMGAADYDNHVFDQLIKSNSLLLNVQNAFGRTALHSAVMGNQTKNTKVLIEMGANINVPDIYLETPLNVAMDWGDDCIPILRAAEAIAGPGSDALYESVCTTSHH